MYKDLEGEVKISKNEFEEVKQEVYKVLDSIKSKVEKELDSHKPDLSGKLEDLCNNVKSEILTHVNKFKYHYPNDWALNQLESASLNKIEDYVNLAKEIIPKEKKYNKKINKSAIQTGLGLFGAVSSLPLLVNDYIGIGVTILVGGLGCLAYGSVKLISSGDKNYDIYEKYNKSIKNFKKEIESEIYKKCS